MPAHARDAAPPEKKFAAAHAAHSAFVQSALAGKLDIPIASALAINNVAVFPLRMLRNRIFVFMGISSFLWCCMTQPEAIHWSCADEWRFKPFR
jgi:hypothetical protein